TVKNQRKRALKSDKTYCKRLSKLSRILTGTGDERRTEVKRGGGVKSGLLRSNTSALLQTQTHRRTHTHTNT
uniref:Uncharacterized protein n=1 Tax=Anopheles quadriannulatus TaxID=34691 RepID=A0A182XRS8_ANOQN